ncbi:MAG: DUF4010 domain-containing protein [Arachidicoccus sp.]|nr:DUF4010 domain-containing protein [Arachidicoccus sp.]
MDNNDFLHYPAAPMALKMAVAIGIGMLIGMERKWSNKEIGIRTFSIVALFGMLTSILGLPFSIAGIIGIFVLIVLVNIRSILDDNSLEATTSVALIVDFILGVLVGVGHMFTPVASAIIMTMLLALKTELNKFAGGLQLSEIRSAIILGLIGFVIYPILPNRFVDHWHLFNPSDAWISIIAIALIGFVNYVLLKVFSTRGLYLGAIFGGLINSTATIAEMSQRAESNNTTGKLSALCLLTTIAMFLRNLLLIAVFSPASLTAILLPLLLMSIIASVWLWRDYTKDKKLPDTSSNIKLDSPISISKILKFGIFFIIIQVSGTILTKIFGAYGILATGFFGGLVSSASTTTAAATMAMHGTISPSVAGSAAVLSSLASAIVNLPIIWRIVQDTKIKKKITIQISIIVLAGIIMVAIDRAFGVSEIIFHA